MDTNGYLTFLVLGVALVAIDGVIVYRSGRAMLGEAYRDPRASRSMAQLVTVLFHLVVLGLLALISTIDVNTGSQVQDVVVKLGVVLLVLGLAHAVTMGILSRIRDRLREEKITDELVEQHGNGRQRPPTVSPIGDEYHDQHPAVSPPIEERKP
ncbi:MAG TPA: hypothetical protein VGX25_06570 [Actinophytocola sp.]|uniref:hypothetical protein n=1 Tax=Actinophytocola sp. TaxID=1872138 RepID=UPI002DDCC5CA|nr:hypothetical protein [Actinophytocola sp.]HEV2779051.1 hypothetical protein [Actinophytocola sp.]